jgi:hypothetical protein
MLAAGVGGQLAARRRGDDQGAVPGDRVQAAQGVVGLAADRLHLLRLVAKSSANILFRADAHGHRR